MKKVLAFKALKSLLVILIVMVGFQIAIAQEATDNDLESKRFQHSIDPEKKLLIDFNAYEARIAAEMGKLLVRDPVTGEIQMEDFNYAWEIGQVYPETDPARENVGGDIPIDETGAPLYRVTADDMRLAKWTVSLNSSADTISNRIYSYTRSVIADCKAEDAQLYENLTANNPLFQGLNVGCNEESQTASEAANGAMKVLGVRIHFPTHHFNAWAEISPPFDIKVYDELGGVVNLENGVANNTGTIHFIQTVVAGRNFNYGLAVRVRNEDHEIEEYYMGNLFFDGWRTLTWTNPNYIVGIDHRELFRLPLYPQEVPHLVFDSFIVYRDGDVLGGDFVTYFKRVFIKYDLAVAMDQRADINDEDVWNILAQQAQERAESERKRFIEYIDLLRQEQAKMGVTYEPPEGGQGGGNQGGQGGGNQGGQGGGNQ